MNTDWKFWKRQAEKGLVSQHAVEEARRREEKFGHDVCGQHPCMCKGSAEDEVIEKVFQALMKPKRWRRKLLKWLFPEIIKAAAAMREY